MHFNQVLIQTAQNKLTYSHRKEYGFFFYIVRLVRRKGKVVEKGTNVSRSNS